METTGVEYEPIGRPRDLYFRSAVLDYNFVLPKMDLKSWGVIVRADLVKRLGAGFEDRLALIESRLTATDKVSLIFSKSRMMPLRRDPVEPLLGGQFLDEYDSDFQDCLGTINFGIKSGELKVELSLWGYNEVITSFEGGENGI